MVGSRSIICSAPWAPRPRRQRKWPPLGMFPLRRPPFSTGTWRDRNPSAEPIARQSHPTSGRRAGVPEIGPPESRYAQKTFPNIEQTACRTWANRSRWVTGRPPWVCIVRVGEWARHTVLPKSIMPIKSLPDVHEPDLPAFALRKAGVNRSQFLANDAPTRPAAGGMNARAAAPPPEPRACSRKAESMPPAAHCAKRLPTLFPPPSSARAANAGRNGFHWDVINLLALRIVRIRQLFSFAHPQR